MADAEPTALCEARVLALQMAVAINANGTAETVERDAQRFVAFLLADEQKDD
jgi:hypothetical protein